MEAHFKSIELISPSVLYICVQGQCGTALRDRSFRMVRISVIDTTLPEQVKIGELNGVTGPVRSWM